MPRPRKKKLLSKIRIGQEVGVLLAGRVLPALIIEDRGNLGVGGRQIVRVELKPSKYDAEGREPSRFEVSIDALVTRRGKPVAKLIPVERGGSALLGCLKGKIHVKGDLLSTGIRWDADAES